MNQREFKPGFRLSMLDAAVIVIAAINSYLLAENYSFWLGVGVAFVVAHFLLFCNVLRASRPLELSWSAFFVLLAALASLLSMPTWPVLLVLAALATPVVAVLELLKPSYHGLGWQVVNPDLPEWWRRSNEQ